MTLLNYVLQGKPMSLLDVGCGDCTEGEEIIRAGVSLTGIDQDGETLEAVRRRFPGGTFRTMNAADFEAEIPYDVILIRRPDLILGSENWKRIFHKISHWLAKDGLVIVTTQGAAERQLAVKYLTESGAGNIQTEQMNWEEESYMIRADDFQKLQKEEAAQRNPLVDELMWRDDQSAWVCDAETGVCSLIPPATAKRPYTFDKFLRKII